MVHIFKPFFFWAAWWHKVAVYETKPNHAPNQRNCASNKAFKQMHFNLVMLKIAVLGSTKGTDLQYIIDAIESGKLKDVSIEVVLSNKSAAYILERAREHDIPAVWIDQKDKTREEFDREVMKLLDEKKVDLVVLIGYMRFLSKEFVEKWRWKVINVHPSLLPKFAGGMDRNVHEAVLKAGEKESGMTIHFVDEGADTGPMILQKRCSIDAEETPDTLKEKVQKLEGEGFVEVVGMFRDGKISVSGGKVLLS